MAEETEGRKLEIKKYANRRYYDSTHSRHLKLEEIRELVQQGYDLHVTEAKTGRNITGQVLIQVLLELNPEKLDLLPIPLLSWLLRQTDHSVKDFIQKQFKDTLKSFVAFEQQLEQQTQSHGLPGALPLIAEWAKAVVAPLTARSSSSAAKAETSTSDHPPSQNISDEFGEMLNALKTGNKEFKGEQAPDKKRKAKK